MSDRAPRSIDDRDMRAIIEVASRKAEERADPGFDDDVTRAELLQIAAELDLTPEDVESAIAEVKRRRVAEAVDADRSKLVDRLRRRRIQRIVAGVGIAIVLLALWAPFRLGGRLSEVEQRRSHVMTALDRQRSVEARLADRTPDRNVDAERAGAENRVRIEQRLYDEAATAYNRSASGLTGVMGGLFGYPERVPLAGEADWSGTGSTP